MPTIARLGHVGLHVTDLERSTAFYRDVLGLTVTDRDDAIGMVFMSARPDEEHHELLLCAGRTAPADAKVLQQVAFRCNTLADVMEYHDRLRAHGVRFDMVVSHGNAIGVYFYDPDGNRCEVYWGTGLIAQQPYLRRVDLSRPADEVLREVERAVREGGGRAFVDASILERQEIPAPSEASPA